MNQSTINNQRSTIVSSRRRFLGAAASAVAAPYIVPASALGLSGHTAPSNRITMGAIGIGGRGLGNLKSLLQVEQVQFIAVADPAEAHSRDVADAIPTFGREPARQAIQEHYSAARDEPWKGCDAYSDFRRILERADIDAVLISTPDHWHAPIVVAAARAGKDMYCEKPLSLTIAEGRAMSDAVARHGVVFQTGSQQRSSVNFRHTCELVRNGRIGKLHTMEVGLPTGPAAEGFEYGAPPADLDYDLWLGPAPQRPYSRLVSHRDFRWNYDYSGGQVTDWGAHHCDIGQWANGTSDSGPVEIEGKAEFPADGIYNTPIHFRFVARYADGVRMIVSDSYENGVRFIGADGWIFVSRSRMEARPGRVLSEKIGPDEVRLYRSDDHYQNFVECVRTRRPTVAPIENAHRSISIAHLGNIAMILGRKLRWDPAAERFIGDTSADRMTDRARREPWTI